MKSAIIAQKGTILKDLGNEYEMMTVESIFEEILEFSTGKGQGDGLIVMFYGNYKDRYKNPVIKMMQKLDETGRNVPIPCRK